MNPTEQTTSLTVEEQFQAYQLACGEMYLKYQTEKARADNLQQRLDDEVARTKAEASDDE